MVFSGYFNGECDFLMTQNESILEYLKAGNSLSPLEALEKFGCLRLGARIWDLEKQGHKIKHDLVTEHGKTFSRYSILGMSGNPESRLAALGQTPANLGDAHPHHILGGDNEGMKVTSRDQIPTQGQHERPDSPPVFFIKGQAQMDLSR